MTTAADPNACRRYALLLTTRVEPASRRPLGRALAAGAATTGMALVAMLATLAIEPDEAPALEITLPPAMPVDLIAMTRGAQAAQVETGQAAQAINASLPFSRAPLEAARPFVLRTASMTDEQRALHCLTQAVYYEAGYEPVEGRRAVAQVVLNRVRHPAFPNSVCGVVYDGSSRPGCQFSFTCDGSLRRPPATGAWAAAERIAREALAGTVASGVGMATHYHANYVAPHWAPRLTKLRQIGAHIFYRWPGGWGRQAAFRSPYAGIEAAAAASLEPGAAPVAIALPPDPTDRHAPEDVGGRLDVTKGWTLTIPLPAETGGNFANAAGRQGPVPANSPPAEVAAVE